MDNNLELTINGHTFIGWVDEDMGGSMMECFFDFHLKPNSQAATHFGGTYFRCRRHLGHTGKHSIFVNQMIHEVTFSIKPEG